MLERLAELTPAERTAVFASLPPEVARSLPYAWEDVWARPSQLAPGSRRAADPRSDWAFWLAMAGRGWGKTRTGAEFCRQKAHDLPGSHGAIIAATVDDARKTMLSAGLEHQPEASGILAISPPGFVPRFEVSTGHGRLVWPNGSVADLYSAEVPGRLRGPQHHWGWVDEIAAWGKQQEAWDQFLFGLRLGDHPQAVITTTPRPLPIVRDLIKNPRCVVTRGSSYDNRANLSPEFFRSIIARHEGTRLGRQEIHGELLEDVEGALWTYAQIDKLRRPRPPALRYVLVSIDPAVTSTETSDETGIILFGVGDCDCKVREGGEVETHGFVLDDLSGRYTPDGWARKAIEALRHAEGDCIIAEVNNGGDLVEANLRTVDRNIAYKSVHASRGKRPRAEPAASLYEQGKIHHCATFPALEDQMCSWEPLQSKYSPDRLDALVWAVWDSMVHDEEAGADFIMRAKW